MILLGTQKQKADVGFLHVGLLIDQPSGTAGLPFIQSSDARERIAWNCDSKGNSGGCRSLARFPGVRSSDGLRARQRAAWVAFT
jgi:hypothetical protein